MAGQGNGHVKKEYGHDRSNGYPVGHTAVLGRRQASHRSWTLWTMNNIARLSVWYALITILFRCPTSTNDLLTSSPAICKPFLTASCYVQPFTRPSYDRYIVPQVEKVRPYYEQANSHIFTPVSNVVMITYHQYAEPQLEKALDLGKAQWDTHAVPLMQKAQTQTQMMYEGTLAPHVSHAAAVVSPYYSTAVDTATSIHREHVLPALEMSKPHFQNAYSITEKFISGTALPVTQHAWTRFVIFVDGTFWPFVKNVYRHNVKPQLVMISERIAKYQQGRKLQVVLDEAEAEAEAGGTTVATPSSESSNVGSISDTATNSADPLSSFVASIVEDMSIVAEEVSSSILPQSTREVKHATDQSISDDLTKWQKKFAAAADKGADDLRDRVKEIIDALVHSDLEGEGRGLASALQKSSELEIEKLKIKIQAVAGSMSDEASETEVEKAQDEILQAVRAAGSEIRDRAKKVRSWAQDFQNDVSQRTLLAADSTLQVLDSIRDLGLQEIGMRWAWMEGVTYKHWQKYHDLRQRFDDWRKEVRDVAIQHQTALDAREAAQALLEESMAITEDVAKELLRLKDVAIWKIRARDSSDDFESRAIPAAVVSAASKLVSGMEEVTSSLAAATQGTLESIVSQASASISSLSSDVVGSSKSTNSIVSQASDGISVAASAVSAVIGNQADAAQSVIQEAATAVEDLGSTFSSNLVGTSTGPIEAASSRFSDGVVSASSAILGGKYASGSMASQASSSFASISSSVLNGDAGSIYSAASSVLSDASSVVIARESPVAESLLSVASSSASSVIYEKAPRAPEQVASFASSLADDASKSVSSVASQASQSVSSMTENVAPKPPIEHVSSVSEAAEDVYQSTMSSVSSAVSSASSRVFAGAMAQEVRGQIPIFDDIFDDDVKSSISSLAESIVNEAGDKYADISKAVSEAFYGTSQGTIESVTSVAADQYQSAILAASRALYGTPTAAAQSVAAEISDRYAEAVAAARSVIFPSKETYIASSVLAQASSVYRDTVQSAESFRSAAADVVSAQMFGTPQPIHSQMIASISSAYLGAVQSASAQLDVAMSAVAGQYSSISGVVSAAVPTQNSFQSVQSIASSRLRDALNVASSQYIAAKVAVGATPTPALMQAQQNYYAAIGFAYDQYSSFTSAGSSAIYGTATPVYQSYIDRASSQYVQASSAAGSSFHAYMSSISSAASQAANKNSPTQSLLDRASSSYAAALSAASKGFLSASEQASIAVLGTRAPAYQQAIESISSHYALATAAAESNFDALLKSASSAVGKKQKNPAQSVIDSVQSQYKTALAAAASSLAIASSSVSSAFYGPPSGSLESLSSAASANWEELVAKASQNIYGQPTPVWASLTSQASDVASQATEAVADRFVIIQSFVSELVIGKEPEFTDSVMSRLSSAYYTGLLASASAFASEAYASGSSAYSSVSSAASSFFTPPPEVNAALESFNEQMNAAIVAASEGVFGTSTGYVESASSAAADAYSVASSAVQEAVYGSQPSYGEAAQESIAAAAQSASSAISIAIFGTPTGQIESASAAIASAYASASSVMAEQLASAGESGAAVAEAAKARVSEAMFGPKQGALESAQSRIRDAVRSAQDQVAGFGGQAGHHASSLAVEASKSVESIASVVSETISSATEQIRDEL